MRTVTLLLAAVTVVSLNGVLLLGAAGDDLGAPPGAMGALVLTLDVSLVASSLLLGMGFARRGRRWLAALFLGNLAIFAVAAALRASEVVFRPAVLFAADLYWLNLYLIVLSRHWRRILGISSDRNRPVDEAGGLAKP